MRARNIKPGFYKNADLIECSIWARHLAPGLWMMADREGRLEDRPKQIKIEIFPCDNVDINQLLDELVTHNHIERYEVDGKRFIQICKFSEHQRPHTNEVASVIPPKQEVVTKKKKAVSTKVESTSNQGEKHFALIPDTLTTDSLNADCLIPESLPNGSSARATSQTEKITLEILSLDHNVEWLAEKRSQGRYLHHDENFVLEYFKNYCRSKGKKYANYLAAYRNSFEWKDCQPRANGFHARGAITKDDRARAAVQRAATAGSFAPESG